MIFSIIINNFNYGCFIKQAIDSAINQTYSRKEIIVVDDGSKDGSQEIIQSYGSQIHAVFKKNGGQASAYNAGFAASKGELVLFLDADDFLYPMCLESITNSWNATCSKAHFPLDIVNEEGKPVGKKIPRVLHGGDVLPLLEKFGHYSSPPGSGNVYAFSYLRQILPLPEDLWRGDADSIPISLAPLFGRIMQIETPLAAHRVHGKSPAMAGTSGLNNPDCASRVASFAHRESLRYGALKHEAKRRMPSLSLPRFPQSPHLLRMQIDCLLHHQAKPYSTEIRERCLLGCKSSISFPGYTYLERIMLVCWFLLLLCTPRLSIKLLRYFTK